VLEFNIILLQIFTISSFLIILFIYSIFSSELLTCTLILGLFLILIIPLYIALENLQLLILNYNLENIVFFKIIFYYCNIINTLIGSFLVIQLIYLIITS